MERTKDRISPPFFDDMYNAEMQLPQPLELYFKPSQVGNDHLPAVNPRTGRVCGETTIGRCKPPEACTDNEGVVALREWDFAVGVDIGDFTRLCDGSGCKQRRGERTARDIPRSQKMATMPFDSLILWQGVSYSTSCARLARLVTRSTRFGWCKKGYSSLKGRMRSDESGTKGKCNASKRPLLLRQFN